MKFFKFYLFFFISINCFFINVQASILKTGIKKVFNGACSFAGFSFATGPSHYFYQKEKEDWKILENIDQYAAVSKQSRRVLLPLMRALSEEEKLNLKMLKTTDSCLMGSPVGAIIDNTLIFSPGLLNEISQSPASLIKKKYLFVHGHEISHIKHKDPESRKYICAGSTLFSYGLFKLLKSQLPSLSNRPNLKQLLKIPGGFGIGVSSLLFTNLCVSFQEQRADKESAALLSANEIYDGIQYFRDFEEKNISLLNKCSHLLSIWKKRELTQQEINELNTLIPNDSDEDYFDVDNQFICKLTLMQLVYLGKLKLKSSIISRLLDMHPNMQSRIKYLEKLAAQKT